MTTSPAQPKKGSTQRFLELIGVRESIALFEGGRASTIIKVKSTNFSLLSAGEQDAQMISYATLLNSLSFPIQIMIRNKKIEIEPYLKLLDTEADKSKNPALANQIRMYRQFVGELVKTSTVLDKQFYIVIPFSAIEGGIAAGKSGLMPTSIDNDSLFFQAKASLYTKADSITNLVSRIGLQSSVLSDGEIIQLFYDFYNPDSPSLHLTMHDLNSYVWKGKEKK